jgi:hypothetical protein
LYSLIHPFPYSAAQDIFPHSYSKFYYTATGLPTHHKNLHPRHSPLPHRQRETSKFDNI